MPSASSISPVGSQWTLTNAAVFQKSKSIIVGMLSFLREFPTKLFSSSKKRMKVVRLRKKASNRRRSPNDADKDRSIHHTFDLLFQRHTCHLRRFTSNYVFVFIMIMSLGSPRWWKDAHGRLLFFLALCEFLDGEIIEITYIAHSRFTIRFIHDADLQSSRHHQLVTTLHIIQSCRVPNVTVTGNFRLFGDFTL
jgi:hypothetical protein